MKKSLLISFIALLFFVSCKQQTDHFTIAFYNTENLFDTIDDPNKKDDEFTPNSKKQWNEKRYQKKITNIAHVLSSIDKESLPTLIGLCEVENQKVLEDLVASPALAKGNYSIAHIESPDIRGIDVALLYRSNDFKIKQKEAIPIYFPGELDYKTRDILHVSGKIGKENFDVYVNHWPSRIGGMKKSEPKRVLVASVLKKKIKKVLRNDPETNIIIMGDMNDEPTNKSLLKMLDAKAPEAGSEFSNLMFYLDQQNLGSYNYRGNWNMLDNLIVSASLLNHSGWDVENAKGYIFRKKWMEYTNKKGETSPSRTYGGPNYYGGISDHFPVYFILKKY